MKEKSMREKAIEISFCFDYKVICGFKINKTSNNQYQNVVFGKTIRNIFI
jgi:hypothetical protein